MGEGVGAFGAAEEGGVAGLGGVDVEVGGGDAGGAEEGAEGGGEGHCWLELWLWLWLFRGGLCLGSFGVGRLFPGRSAGHRHFDLTIFRLVIDALQDLQLVKRLL